MNYVSLTGRCWRLWSGRTTWSGRTPTGAIWPGTRAIWSVRYVCRNPQDSEAIFEQNSQACEAKVILKKWSQQRVCTVSILLLRASMLFIHLRTTWPIRWQPAVRPTRCWSVWRTAIRPTGRAEPVWRTEPVWTAWSDRPVRPTWSIWTAGSRVPAWLRWAARPTWTAIPAGRPRHF